MEVSGIEFSVGKDSGMTNRVTFRVQDDLAHISVATGREEGIVYSVGLDDGGICRLRRDADYLDPWQVLKAALEPLLFG